MIYQTTISIQPSRHIDVYPNNTGIGYDRLSYNILPVKLGELIRQFIDSGEIERYFGPYDSMVTSPGCITSQIAWKNKQSANDWLWFHQSLPGFISGKITEISNDHSLTKSSVTQ